MLTLAKVYLFQLGIIEMKTYHFVLGLLAIISFIRPASAEGIALYKTEELRFENQDGREIVYDQSDELFNGAVVLPDDEGRKITYIYKNGQKNGVAVSRYADGKVEFETTYADGVKNGEELLFSANQIPQYKKTYKNNVLDGEYIVFYANGKPKQKDMYSAGLLSGESMLFDENGNIKKIIHYKNGNKDGVERIIENNILVEENVYKEGVLHGITKKYDAKYLTDEISYQNGEKEGLHTTYSSKGGKREVPYHHDKKSGIASAYYPTGKLARRVSYINDKRNGVAEKWDEQGVLRESENYKNDMKDGIGRVFDEQGLLTQVHYTVKDTVLANVDILQHDDLKEIYIAYLQGVLNEYSGQKTNWYKILWLGISTGDIKILQELSNQMKMYGYNIADIQAYQKESGHFYNDENRQLFFGLTPLSYAVNLASPVEILQLFANSAESVNALNERGTSPLQEAVRLNNIDMVKYLLLRGADASKGQILADAIKEDAQLSIIEELLKAGADVNKKDDRGNTTLLLALQRNDVEILSLLLQYNIDLKGKAANGENMLFYAYKHNAPYEILSAIISAGIDVNEPDAEGRLLLITALENGDEKLVEHLLKAGADVNKTDSKGISAIVYVLHHFNDSDIEKKIILQGNRGHNLPQFNRPLWQVLADENLLDMLDAVLEDSNMDKTDINGTVPQNYLLQKNDNPELIDIALKHISAIDDELLWLTVRNNDAETLQKLVTKGGDVNAKNEQGVSLLEWILQNKTDKKLLQALVSPSLEVNTPDASGELPLEIATKNNDSVAVKFLLQQGADVNIKVDDNLLISTLTIEQDEVTKLLLGANADLQYVNPEKQTVLMLAVAQLNLPLIEAYISQYKDNIFARDNLGNNALHYLASGAEKYANLSEDKLLSNIEKCLRVLTDSGLNINEQNGNGETLAIRLAKKKVPHRREIEALLQKLGADLAIKDQYRKTAADYWER